MRVCVRFLLLLNARVRKAIVFSKNVILSLALSLNFRFFQIKLIRFFFSQKSLSILLSLCLSSFLIILATYLLFEKILLFLCFVFFLHSPRLFYSSGSSIQTRASYKNKQNNRKKNNSLAHQHIQPLKTTTATTTTTATATAIAKHKQRAFDVFFNQIFFLSLTLSLSLSFLLYSCLLLLFFIILFR